MFVKCWNVGATTSSNLPMTIQEVCGQLASDWIPSLPATVSSSFMGWPPYLIDSVHVDGTDFLALKEEAGRSDRQWKGVLSWMIGIAGARHFLLNDDGYRWIAPLSAFYPSTTRAVDLHGWNLTFPPSSVVAERVPGARSRLRPDYIVLRPGNPRESPSYQWAVAEAKGTCRSLGRLIQCPADWYDQARSICVKHNGSPLVIQRHLVIATRANPTASHDHARRLQLRAWNSEEDTVRTLLPGGAAVDVVAAHLFGLCKVLHLRENARALALATHMRALARRDSKSRPTDQDLERVVERASDELQGRTQPHDQKNKEESAVIFIEADYGTIEIEISAPTVRLVRKLQRSRTEESAQEALREADNRLDEWSQSLSLPPKEPERVNLPFGVRLLMPRDLRRQN